MLKDFLSKQPAPARPMAVSPRVLVVAGLSRRDFARIAVKKKIDPDQLTLRHFFEQLVEVFTHADNRFFRSFKLLITRPGFLTNEYMNGRRKPYLQPVQLFLVANLLFFFVQTFSVLQPLTTALWLHTHNMPYQERAQKIVDEEIARQHLTLEEYSSRFNAKEETESKAWVIVMVPCLAVNPGPCVRA